MSTLDQARATQLKNIESKTGLSLDELRAIIQASGLSKHAEIRQMLIERFGLGFGDATMLVHFARSSDGQSAAETANLSSQEVLNEIYTGSRAPLRPIHEALLAAIQGFGEFEVVPKKGYVSLRRKRQFAMLGPGTRGRFEVGINLKGLEGTARLEAQPPGGMCQYKVFLTSAAEVDAELIGWLRLAHQAAG
jgi:hypothetical protein